MTMLGIPSASTDTRRPILMATEAPDTGSILRATEEPFSREDEQRFLSYADKTTGAPMRLRMALAAVRRPAQKLEILRKIDPNAQPYGKDNFVYTPPGGSQPVVVDPQGFSLREMGKDIMESFPFLAELAGGIGGGMAGGAVGSVPGAIAGAAGGAALFRDRAEQGMMQASGVQDPRTMGQHLGDVAVTAGANALGEGAGRLAAPVGRAVAGRLAETPMGLATREAATRLQVPLTAGMETGRRFLRTVEASLASNPVTFGIMGKSWQDATEAAGNASRRIVQSIARGGDTHPGSFTSALQSAAKARIARYENARLAMDNAIGSLIPETTMVPLDHVEKALGNFLAFQSKAPQSLAPEVSEAISYAAKMLEDAKANGGAIPFDVLRRLRTTVGEATQFGAMGDKIAGSSQHLQELYGAIKDDILEGARLVDRQALAAGLPAPGAEQAVKIHDAFVKLNRDPDNPVGIAAMQKLMEVNPTDPTSWAVSVVRNPSQGAAIRKAVTPEEWDAIAGSIFEDMGRGKPGAQDLAGDVWSPTTFLTNWNRLRDSGREALFGGTRYASTATDINALARIADTMRESAKLGNTSNTARALMVPLIAKTVLGAGAIAGTGMAAGSRVGGLAGTGLILSSYSAAKILTSPKLLHAIRGAVQSTALRGPSFVARLAAIGRADPALQGAVNEYIAAIGAAGYPLPNPEDVQQLNTGQPNVQFTPR